MSDGTRDLAKQEALNVTTTVISTADIYSFYDSPEKELVGADDIFLVEDSDDGWKKKKVKSSNVIFLGKGSIIYTPERFIETGLATTKSKTPIALHGMSKTIEQEGNYEVVFNGQFACLHGNEVVLIAIYVDNEMITDTRRIIKAESYVVGQTDTAIEGLQIGQVLHVRWWTEKGRSVIAEARSMRIRRYV
jgi:hypothetical protein